MCLANPSTASTILRVWARQSWCADPFHRHSEDSGGVHPTFAGWPAALRRPAPPATLAQWPTLITFQSDRSEGLINIGSAHIGHCPMGAFWSAVLVPVTMSRPTPRSARRASYPASLQGEITKHTLDMTQSPCSELPVFSGFRCIVNLNFLEVFMTALPIPATARAFHDPSRHRLKPSALFS